MRQKQLDIRQRRQESGFVSIFTVLFFVLMITIITVGFLRVTSQEQRQAIDNDLTASALSSAEAGIEDAKRAILRYTKLGAGALRTQYATALNSTACDSLFGNTYTAVRDDLKLDPTGKGQVSARPELRQSYTCLTVAMNTRDYVNKMDAGKSDYIPLRADSAYDSVVVSWHHITDDGQPAAYASGTASLLPVAGDSNTWGGRGYPAYLRVQVFGYPTGAFNLDALEQLSRTVFLAPTNLVGQKDETNPVDLSGSDSRDSATGRVKSSPIAVTCKGTPPNVTTTYACSVKLRFTGALAPTSDKNLFLRVTPVYGPTSFKVELARVSGSPNFVEVQPVVDATGKAGDVYRRVQARVRLDAAPVVPEYVLENAHDVCKDFVVTNSTADFVDNCP